MNRDALAWLCGYVVVAWLLLIAVVIAVGC